MIPEDIAPVQLMTSTDATLRSKSGGARRFVAPMKFKILVMHPMAGMEEEEAVIRVIRSGWWISGPECAAFEREFGEHVGGHAVTVSSATAGMHLVLEALELERDPYSGEPLEPVCVPALTHIATADAARMAHRVKLCDVDDALLLQLPSGLIDDVPFQRDRIFGAAALMPVDLYGRLWRPPAETYGLPIIIDAAHSVGTWTLADRVAHWKGNHRVAAFVFSFHAMKNMGVGEGGMVVTSDPALAREVKILREHGQDRDAPGRPFTRFGFKYNMPDLAAALGREQLKKLPGWMARRRELADRYEDLLGPLNAPNGPIKIVPRDPHLHPHLDTPHLYVIRISHNDNIGHLTRDAVMLRMAEQGIQTLVHYKSLSVDGPYAEGAGTCPVAEKAGEEVLTLPLWPGLTYEEQDEVVGALERSLGT